MTATFSASATHIGTTTGGGRIVIQGEDITLGDALIAFVFFLLSLWRGGVITAYGETVKAQPVAPKRRAPKPSPLSRFWRWLGEESDFERQIWQGCCRLAKWIIGG